MFSSEKNQTISRCMHLAYEKQLIKERKREIEKKKEKLEKVFVIVINENLYRNSRYATYEYASQKFISPKIGLFSPVHA